MRSPFAVRRALLAAPLIAVACAAYAACGLSDQGTGPAAPAEAGMVGADVEAFTTDASADSPNSPTPDALEESQPPREAGPDGAADAADSGSDAHPSDAGTPDSGGSLCADAGGRWEGGTCTVGCPAPSKDGGGPMAPCTVDCPPGLSCTVDCSQPNACKGDVTCTGGTSCTVECSSMSACGGNVTCGSTGSCSVKCAAMGACGGDVTCTAGSCAIDCVEMGTCAGDVTCATSGTCAVTCSGMGSCKDNVCCDASACMVPDGSTCM